MLKLYDYFRSSASYRVRIVLNFKKIDFTKHEIHLVNNNGEQNSADYRKINPQSLVPCLIDGEHTLTQSLAIIEYLEEQYPKPSILPKDPYSKALARSMGQIIASDVHPLNNLRVLNYLKDNFNISDEHKLDWYYHWLKRGFESIEYYVNHYNKGYSNIYYCLGNELSIADVCLIPQVYNALRFKLDMSEYRSIMSIYNHCLTQDYIIDSQP